MLSCGSEFYSGGGGDDELQIFEKVAGVTYKRDT